MWTREKQREFHWPSTVPLQLTADFCPAAIKFPPPRYYLFRDHTGSGMHQAGQTSTIEIAVRFVGSLQG
jgi:hypothetical protein